MTTREIKRAEARKRAKEFSPKYVEIPARDWPKYQPFKGVTRVFQNNLFVVLVCDDSTDPEGRKAILSGMRPNIGKPLGVSLFKHLQDCKNQLFGDEAIGRMYLPKESELFDDANMYWFFVTLTFEG